MFSKNDFQLKTIFRQDDNDYKKILNQIRVGRITKSTVEKLKKLVGRQSEQGETILPTVLYPTRKKVERINSASLKELKGDEIVYDFSVVPDSDMTLSEKQKQMLALFTQEQKDKIREHNHKINANKPRQVRTHEFNPSDETISEDIVL